MLISQDEVHELGGAMASSLGFPMPETVWTPQVDSLVRKVRRWIQMDLPGGAVVGAQRTGKTKACQFMVGTLSDLLGYQLAIIHFVISGQVEAKKTERDFFLELMGQIGCQTTAARDTSILRKRCLRHLSEMAAKSGSGRIVILVDEAQHLSKAQYDILIYIFNMLEQARLKPFFLLVGQPELRGTRDLWREASDMQILGRFFARLHVFRGVGKDEVKLVLEAFDTPASEGGDSPFAKFVPGAYASGWRLVRLAPAFERALSMLMARQGITEGLRLPMQDLRTTLLGLIYQVQEEGLALEHIDEAMVFHMLQETEFFGLLSRYLDDDIVLINPTEAKRG